MILFIFEGDDREPRLYKTLERLIFQRRMIISFVRLEITSMTSIMKWQSMMGMVILYR